jgi:cysteine synthase
MDGEEVGRRGIPTLLKPSSSSSDGSAGEQEHIASDVTQVLPSLATQPFWL